MANAYAAIDKNLTIVPAVNKIDMQAARVEGVMEEMEQFLGLDIADIQKCSGKTGIGVEDVLAAVIERVPPPQGDPESPLQAMVFDSHYDDYRGAITYVRLMNGTVARPEDPLLEGRRHVRSAGTGAIRPPPPGVRQAGRRPGGLPDLQHQVARPRCMWATR